MYRLELWLVSHQQVTRETQDSVNPVVLRLLSHLDQLHDRCLTFVAELYRGFIKEPGARHDWVRAQPGKAAYLLSHAGSLLITCIFGYAYLDEFPSQTWLLALIAALLVTEKIFAQNEIECLLYQIRTKLPSSDIVERLIAGTLDVNEIFSRISPIGVAFIRKPAPSLESTAAFVAYNIDWILSKPTICYRGSWYVIIFGFCLAVPTLLSFKPWQSSIANMASILVTVPVFSSLVTDLWRRYIATGALISHIESKYLVDSTQAQD